MREWIDLATAAKRIGHKDSSALRHLIRRGRIPPEALMRIGSSWAIDSDWLAEHKRAKP